jgi:hypothetical protein
LIGQTKAQGAGKSKPALVAEVLSDAMRYVRADGKIGWKLTPQMLDRLADAKREAVEDAEHDLP